MSLLDFFNKKSSASTAAERLKIVVAHERSANLPYIDNMKKELLEVIKKYTNTSKINIKTNSNQNISMLEVEIMINEKVKQ